MTVILPGSTVSVQPVHAPTRAGRLLALSETVVLWPEASVPDVGETVTWPISPDDSAMDQSTDPNDADRVSVPPFTPTTIVVGVTVKMPRAGGELVVAEALLVVGLGFGLGFLLGFGLDLAFAEVEGDGFPLWPGEAELVDEPAVGAVLLPPVVGGALPDVGVGDTCAAGFADTVGWGPLLGPPAVPTAAATLFPRPDPGPRAAAPPPPWWPGLPAASATASSVRAATTAAAPTAPAACPDRVRHHRDFGGSSGLGNPW